MIFADLLTSFCSSRKCEESFLSNDLRQIVKETEHISTYTEINEHYSALKILIFFNEMMT